MLEIRHYIDATGKNRSAVLYELHRTHFLEEELYALGLWPPDFPLPVKIEHTLVLEWMYIFHLLKELIAMMDEEMERERLL